MPNPKTYYIKDKVYEGIELTEGEQLILLRENNKRVKEHIEEQQHVYKAYQNAVSNYSKEDD